MRIEELERLRDILQHKTDHLTAVEQKVDLLLVKLRAGHQTTQLQIVASEVVLRIPAWEALALHKFIDRPPQGQQWLTQILTLEAGSLFFATATFAIQHLDQRLDGQHQGQGTLLTIDDIKNLAPLLISVPMKHHLAQPVGALVRICNGITKKSRNPALMCGKIAKEIRDILGTLAVRSLIVWDGKLWNGQQLAYRPHLIINALHHASCGRRMQPVNNHCITPCFRREE